MEAVNYTLITNLSLRLIYLEYPLYFAIIPIDYMKHL